MNIYALICLCMNYFCVRDTPDVRGTFPASNSDLGQPSSDPLVTVNVLLCDRRYETDADNSMYNWVNMSSEFPNIFEKVNDLNQLKLLLCM